MMKIKLFKRIAAFCAVLCLLFTGITVCAAGGADLSRPAVLTVSCRDGDKPLTGAEFSVWLISSADGEGNLTPTPEFAALGVDLNPKTDAGLRALARTLEGFVRRDGMTPAESGTTDLSGNLQLDLSHGLWLVMGERHAQDGYVYEMLPFVVKLPVWNGHSWQYSLTLSPKMDAAPEIGPDEEPDDPTVTRKVLKVWREDDPADRPASVEVQLMRNGRLYDEVKLSEKNNWRHVWRELDGDCRWTVAEEVPDGYTAEVTREGITFVVTNTKTPEADVPTGPADPVDPSEPSSEPSDGPGEPSDPGPDEPGEDLPQTGQLWWPVPMLLCCGLGLIVLGLLMRRHGCER